MPELPSGTITFLFSDIEGSTPLWERSPRAMQAALARHNAILQNSIERHNGQVFKVIGDAFQAAFTVPGQAVAAALEAQRALAAQAWSESGPIRVRMGIHSGPAEVRDGDYLASHTLNRVARIMSAGHGGQILLSAAVADHVRGLLAEEVSLKDLGEHFLKGLALPERIFQLLAPELRPDFPPLVTRITPRGYKLLEQIGEGGFGAVYRALQPGVGREVAIKVILPQFANNPEFIRRFEAEAQLVARLEHPHIVPLYDYWREPDSAFLIMRLLRGGSLENVLERGPLNPAQAAELLEQLAGALAVAHREGVVHRDLKPANVLLDEVGNYYLSDFGIAKDLGRADGGTITRKLLGSPQYMSPEQILGQPVTLQSDIYALGLLLYQVLAGEPPFSGDSPGALIDRQLHASLPLVHQARQDIPQGVDEVLHTAAAKQAEDRFESVADLALAFQAALRGERMEWRPAVPDKALKNPYKGLRAFQEADAGDFFGREALVERLLARLGPTGDAFSASDQGAESGRFLAVVGPSGSGKSSAVRAGLLPALRSGALPGSANWFLVEIIPGSHPLEELEAALLRVAVNPPASLLAQLQEDPRGLLRAVKRILPGDEGAELLLIVDQFEEVFTLVEEQAEARFFLDSLAAAVCEPRGRLRLVITLRADFYDRPLMHPDFSRLVRQHTEAIVPLTSEELSRAISGPARQVGVALEEGLAAQIVAEINEQPGALPLLQYALTELFERRDGRLLTQDAYREIGGVTGALGRRAEEIYQQLKPAGQEAARQVFLRLVTLGEGVEDTRRRVLRSELEGLQGIRDRGKGPVEAVLEAFGKAWLLSFDRDPLTRGPTVEVAHEALLREWPRLRAWLDEGREGLRRQRQLGQLATDWHRSGEDASYLLRGSRLELFESWAAETDLALTGDEQAYLQASLAERKSRREAEALRQAHEAALERRSRNFLRGLVAVFAVAAIVAIALSLFAFNQQRIARENEALAGQNAATAVAARGEAEQLAALRSREAQVNQSLALAAQSRLALQAENLDLALALAWEAVQIPDPPGLAQMALSEAAYPPGTIRIFPGHKAPVWSVAASPDGVYGLSGDEDGVIFLWDLETGEALRRLVGHSRRVSSLVFTPDGRHAFSASHDKTILHWDLETGEIIRQITGHQAPVNTLALSPDGRRLASGSGRSYAYDPFSSIDNSLRLWDLQTGEEIRRFDFADGVTAIDFTTDGQRLAVGTVSDGFQLLEIASGKALINWDMDVYKLGLQTDSVATHSNGIHIYSGGYGGSILMWNLMNGEVTRLDIPINQSSVPGLDISPDGKRFLSGHSNIVEYDLESGEEIQRFNLGANAVIYLPDGRRALVSDEDGSLRLLELRSGAEIGRLPPGKDRIFGIAYDPEGHSVVLNDSISLYRWDLQSGEEVWREPGLFWDIAFSPDGSQILTSDVLAYVSLWDAINGNRLKRLESDGSFVGHAIESFIDAVAFHPSGKYALSGSQGGTTLIYWDLESGKPIWLFDTELVFGVAISPDGHTALSAETDGVKWWDLETGQLLRRLEGHTLQAWAVAFLDDRTAISGSDDSTLILWDLESGTAIRSFLGHSGGVKRVVLSPDKYLAISASRDGTAILWDVQTGEPLRRYAGHVGEMRTVALSPDGKEAMTGGHDYQVIRWRIDADLESFLNWVDQNRYVRPLTCDERAAFQIEPLCGPEAMAEVGDIQATAEPVHGSGTALLTALPLPTPAPVGPASQPSPAEPAGAAAWGENFGSVPVGGGQIWEYSGRAGERLSIRVSAGRPANLISDPQLQLDNGLLDPTLAVFSPDGSLLAQADDLENGLATDAYLASLMLPETGLYRIEVRSYRDQTGGDYRLVLAEPRPLVMKANLPSTTGLAIHPDGRSALAGAGYGPYWDSPVAEDNRIWVWDTQNGEAINHLDGHANSPVSISISPDGRQAISADPNGVAILWDLESGTELRRLDNQGEAFMFILFHPDGQSALTASIDRNLALWDLASGEVVRRFEGHGDWVVDLTISPDGKTVYSTGWDNTLRAWDIASGEQITVYEPFSDSVTAGLAISPDGQKLLVGSDWGGDPKQQYDSDLLLLDAPTGEVRLNLEGHTSSVGALAFSPDGSYALSGSLDRTVRLWEVATGEQLAIFTGHNGDIFNVAFSPDGLTGYSTGTDGSLRVWDLREFVSARE